MDNFYFIKVIAELGKQKIDTNHYMSEEERFYRKNGIELTKEFTKQYHENCRQIVSVVAALIWNKDRFLICQRPQTKPEVYCGNLSAEKLKVVKRKNRRLFANAKKS